MIRLLRVELLKLKRSSSLLMVIALPILVILLSLSLFLSNHTVAEIVLEDWASWWTSINAIWCYFMLPLYISLASVLVNGIEHRNHTWRLMLTQPIDQYYFYFVKCIVVWVLVFLSMLMLWFAGFLSMLFIVIAGGIFDDSIGIVLLEDIPKIMLACLPVLAVQHALSWRYSNVIIPLAFGVVATMGIIQIGSSEYWLYYPWSYMLMSSIGSQELWQQQAVFNGFSIGIIFLVISSIFFVKSSKN